MNADFVAVRPTDGRLQVQVIHALPTQVWCRTVLLAPGAVVADALAVFQREHPDCVPAAAGIYGRRCRPDTPLTDGDRVEIYRALHYDPMQSRRRRAAHRQAPRGRMRPGHAGVGVRSPE